MKYPVASGWTHRSSSPMSELPGAKTGLVRAPDQSRQRAKEWDPAASTSESGAAWSGFAPMLDDSPLR